jgi:hypothetical protein
MKSGILSLTASLVLIQAAAGQACPKVVYINTTATIQSLVNSVNCLVDASERSRTGKAETSKAALSVDALQIIGPQHTRAYRKVIFAVLAVPSGNTTKTALVMPDNAEAVVAATAGAECKVKINSDNTVDAQCSLTGGTLYVVYRN